MTGSVTFYLNGERVVLDDPAPDLLLIDYLRSPEVALTGAKKGCGQGGCGACTVILSSWDAESREPEHRAINSCLRPVCALDGLAVTTIEGTGGAGRKAPPHLTHQPSFSRGVSPGLTEPAAVAEAAEAARTLHAESTAQAEAYEAGAAAAQDPGTEAERMNPVAHRLAMNNGTQCGYCTTGFVMNMTALLQDESAPTKRRIEEAFDGNLCRCTGYRAILTGMKTFASDWTEQDEAARMKCLGDGQARPPAATADIPFPDAARTAAPAPIEVTGNGRTWVTPSTLVELRQIMTAEPGRRLRLVHGNTSYGVYPGEVRDADLLVDIRLIPDIRGITIEDDRLEVGAGTSYRDLIDALAGIRTSRDAGETTRLGVLEYMARRTAGTILRNAASLGGNTMLVLHHIAEKEPFPSDLYTALTATGATIEVWRASTATKEWLEPDELVARVKSDSKLLDDIVLLAYRFPFGGADEVVLAQKVAFRDVNAHSLVNATTSLTLAGDLTVIDAALVFGGIAPYPWRPRLTEDAMTGRPLSLDAFADLAALLRDEVRSELDEWRDRMAGLPSEGVTDAYRVELAESFLYKAIVQALDQRAAVPANDRSAGEITWGHWPVSDGRQHYKIQGWKAPVSQPYIKLMAMFQASGQVHYTHEIPVPPTTLQAAFAQSRRALAGFTLTVPGESGRTGADALSDHLRSRFASFERLITCADVPPQGINLQGMGGDQPLFAVDRVEYVGQAIALVLADTEKAAVEIADYVTRECVGYGPVTWPAPWNKPPWTEPPWNRPLLSLEEAVAIGSVFPDCPSAAPYVSHIWEIVRPGSEFGWVDRNRRPFEDAIVRRGGHIDGAPCVIVESGQLTGGQAHFYLETQSCVVEPADGGRWIVRPSSQSPMEMHQTSAMAIGVEHNRIEVDVRQLGGGYGGKTESARFVTGPAVVAAYATGRPVRLVLPRDEDTGMIGKRHPYYGQYQIAIDDGANRPEDKGLIRGSHTRMWGDGGAFYDCSFIVSNCIQLRADNAYRVRNFANQIDVCRTNTAPNTAFRAFGDVQCKLIVENAIDDAAYAIGMTAEDVREKNMYERGDVTPYGQALTYCYMREVWSYLKEVSRYAEKKREVDAYNAANTWRKRGIAMIPVKYGAGYNFTQLEQAVAHLAVHSGDGSIVIHQGGVDMGQGMMTKVEQIASYILNVPFELIHIDRPRTSVIPNPTSSGASTGTAYNGEAVKQVCEQMRRRLADFGQEMLKEHGEEWCRKAGIDYWNHGKTGWAAKVGGRLIWQNLVQLAYQQRVGLVASFTAPIHGGEDPLPALTFKDGGQPGLPGIGVDPKARPGGGVDSFTGFTYSAACSVVEVDVLTGETKILSSDLMYDIGWSINPAIDVGQVEGAFVQGVGYVLTEQLVYEDEGDEAGRLNTVNTWKYKPPATTTIPLELNTYLFPRDRAASVPENPHDLLSAKEVGEPPLVLATSVFFAVKAAVRASRLERGLDGLFHLDAPATVQEVRRACAVSL
ncbi:2Fe-2S iron-sulfur cluster binding domain-containing protein [Actinomadura darangshiensis]|uniref:2Fe-2S iron-sulfur cluster binding domain-containing protein n=1 Tax=Actinomadura darangshiensis TaxID=705336 RepID=A0A4R5B423_9ACTN|nr:molybdopterin cofactor-binding domain-containing protein [Actinomadura darangshiensis]TDD79026.1 2Fe-2S iron-sulfur cluster binding domain-containing protein [Actinomadura darangshiensis]